MEPSTASNVNGPRPASELVVTVTPVRELVFDIPDATNACHGIPFFSKGSPHRAYQIEISEEGHTHYETADENDLGINYSKSDHDDHSPLCIKAQIRFSTFRRHFMSYPMQHLTRNSRPLIPPKGAVWEDYTHSVENVLERARRMQLFLWDVLNSNGPEILRSHLLQETLSLSPGDRQGLLRIAERRESE
ncbi:unnamed protein product [Cylindrotheca closterium]|uniref:Uncharacterized protein n=1 Tax=Cylindrotheca closterium TaxID=2856 RepID=A0AAD2FIP7_9STRA|nr:unnamed protein product [Cylindrotheca closterium]